MVDQAKLSNQPKETPWIEKAGSLVTSVNQRKKNTMSTNWTTANIPSQKGKIIIVTGANSGLGFGTTRELARKGGKVIMAVRSLDRGASAKEDIEKEIPSAQLELMELDLASLESVKSFASDFSQKYDRLDILINNAGLMMPEERQETEDGFEKQIGVNHLGHFALTNQLLPMLNETEDSRVVTISSMYGKTGYASINWDDLHWEEEYDTTDAYSQSKFANQLFGLELARKLEEAGSGTISTMAHPGYTATNLQRHIGLMGKIGNKLIAQDLDMGILPQLRAATDPDVENGEYLGPKGFMNMRGYPQTEEPNKKAKEPELSEKFWKLSEELTDTNFPL
tara:strand:+ start:49404 stop:50417 length:1014 start_codon:yes stop_codon:yes gene_type:complete